MQPLRGSAPAVVLARLCPGGRAGASAASAEEGPAWTLLPPPPPAPFPGRAGSSSAPPPPCQSRPTSPGQGGGGTVSAHTPLFPARPALCRRERPARASAAPAREVPLPPLGRHQLRRAPALTRFEGRAGRREDGAAPGPRRGAGGGGRNPRGLCRGLCPAASGAVPVPSSLSQAPFGRGSQSRLPEPPLPPQAAATMTFQWTAVAAFLYGEIGVILVLCLPFISPLR